MKIIRAGQGAGAQLAAEGGERCRNKKDLDQSGVSH